MTLIAEVVVFAWWFAAVPCLVISCAQAVVAVLLWSSNVCLVVCVAGAEQVLKGWCRLGSWGIGVLELLCCRLLLT